MNWKSGKAGCLMYEQSKFYFRTTYFYVFKMFSRICLIYVGLPVSINNCILRDWWTFCDFSHIIDSFFRLLSSVSQSRSVRADVALRFGFVSVLPAWRTSCSLSRLTSSSSGLTTSHNFCGSRRSETENAEWQKWLVWESGQSHRWTWSRVKTTSTTDSSTSVLQIVIEVLSWTVMCLLLCLPVISLNNFFICRRLSKFCSFVNGCYRINNYNWFILKGNDAF